MAINRGFDPRAAMAASNPAAYAKAQGLQDRVAAVRQQMPQNAGPAAGIPGNLPSNYGFADPAMQQQQRMVGPKNQVGFNPSMQRAPQTGMQQQLMAAQQRMGGLLGAPMPQQMGGGQDDWASRYTYGSHMQPQQQQPQRSGAMYQHGMQQAAMQRPPMQQFGGGYGMPQQFMPQQSPYSLGFGSQQMMQRPQFMPQQFGGGGYGGGYGMPQQRQQYGYAGPQGGRGYDIQGTAQTRQFTGYPQDIFLGM